MFSAAILKRLRRAFDQTFATGLTQDGSEHKIDIGDGIALAYQLALRREAAADEIAIWSDRFRSGIPLRQIALEISDSEEARRANAEVRRTETPREVLEAAITSIYRLALGREASASEVAEWVSHNVAGLPVAQIVLNIVKSEEARNRPRTGDDALTNAAIAAIYRLAFQREASQSEIAHWAVHLGQTLTFPQFVLEIAASDEANNLRRTAKVFDDLSDGLFIAHLFEIFLGRGASANELLVWRRMLAENGFQRRDLLATFFGTAVRKDEEQAAESNRDPTQVRIMGTDRDLDLSVWVARAKELTGLSNTSARDTPQSPYVVRPNTIRVSAIASLYKGGEYIERFLSNLTQQSLGSNFELIIIDANSPDNEREVIQLYQKTFDNIVYERMNYRIGIYEAWNLGIELARGDYITNTNLDDTRRCDSLQLQADTLDRMTFADVVYQDFFYSLDPNLGFEEIAAFDFKSDLPIVTPNNILLYNSPHNAPMWRKRIHDDVGLFDTSFKSAGDHDFWCRCLLANKIFYKINTPHVIYYQNPDGMSTRPNSRGELEGQRVLKTYGRKLMSPLMYMDHKEYADVLQSVSGLNLPERDLRDPSQATRSEILALLDGHRDNGFEAYGR